MIHRRIYFLFVLFIGLLVIWSSCATRRLNSEKQKLLRENYVLSSTPKPDKSEMRGYIKQRPNRRILTVPFYLWIYNSVNPKREARRVKRHDEKFKAKYNRWREYQSRHKKKEPQRKRTWGEFLYSIGEAPVVYDSIAAQQTCKQLQLYLHNKGYFEGEVRDTFFYRRLKRKQREALVQSLTDSTVKLPHLARLNRGAQRRVHVYYYFKTGTPYTINSVNWVIEDSLMKNNVLSSKDSSYLIPQKAGEIVNYDMDVFSAERDRITSNLRNQGYFLFNKEYIRFAIDSTAKEHKVDVTIIIRNRQELQSDSSLVSVGHKQYTIRKITVRTLASVQELKNDTARLDTLIWTDRAGTRTIHFYRNISLEEQFNIKPEVLAARIRVNREGTLYSQSAIDATYRQLNGLRVFRQVIISPHLGAEDQVDCDIYLLPTLRQSFITQLEGTNTGGNLGLAGQIGFQNNNLLHGAELLDIRLKGGTEAQQAITANQQINAAQQVTLNTIEAAAEISLNIPRAFFPFNKLPIGQAEGRRTTFTFSVNYQRRLDYDRALFNLSYGYTFALGSNGFMGIYPLEFNVVSVTTKAGLAEFLINNRDPLLRYRFTDHFINESRLTYVLKKQYRSRFKPVHYLRTDLGLSGNILRKAFEWSSAERDSIGSYLIAGIPFSQYVRLTFTYIYSMQLGDHQQLVFRIAQGAGLPLTNFPTMPLEKSFFGGGANGIRAWEARSLGPGSYSVPSGERFAQFGDVQAEYNIELRFRITKTLFGALFADGGNIWLIRPDAARPNGDFRVDRFLEDLAFGPGIGLRYDLSFFIARLDWALQVRDPAYSRGDRWYVFQRPLSSNLNFGIGYPF